MGMVGQSKPAEDIFEAIRNFVDMSPVGMWVADLSGTLVFQNAANRKLFGVKNDKDIIGKYNIFCDEEIARAGVMPQIRKIFERGGSTEFTIDYDFTQVKKLTAANPMHQALRMLVYAVRDPSGTVRYVVIQNENYTEEWITKSTLAESENRYRELIEHLSDWLWTTDQQGRILYSNPVVERVLGYRFDEVTGKSMLSFITPEDREQARKIFGLHAEKCEPIHRFTARVTHKDGSLHYLETNAEAVCDEDGNLIGYRGISRDITERVQFQLALVKSEENFRTIFDHVPAAVFTYDMDGVIIRANGGCQRIYGFALEDMIGRSMFETIVRPDERPKREGIIARIFSGETADNVEWEDKRADGSSLYVLTSLAPMYDPSGHVIMGLSLAIDITERRLAEQRRQELEAHKLEFYRRTIQAATDGKLIICDRNKIERIAGSAIETWNLKTSEDVGKIRSRVAEIANNSGMEPSRISDFIVCVGEATTNALKHAGGGTASLHKMAGGLMFVVTDHGVGMSALALPDIALKRGYTTAVSLGMGYKVMITVADEVYLATGPSGTTVAVEMRLNEPDRRSSVVKLPDTW